MHTIVDKGTYMLPDVSFVLLNFVADKIKTSDILLMKTEFKSNMDKSMGLSTG